MHAGELVVALGWLGAFLGIVLNVPQTWRSCAGRQVAGLSPASRWLAVLQAATWTTYGLTGGGLVQVVTNGVCIVLHVAVLVALLRLAPSARAPRLLLPQLSASVAWLLLVAWAASSGGLSVGTLAALCSVAYALPQLVLLLSDLEATEGVSGATVALGVLSNSCWTLYGLLLGTPAVWLPALLSLAAGLATAALLRRPRPGGGPVVVLPRVAACELAVAA